jgi:hypothetical protein
VRSLHVGLQEKVSDEMRNDEHGKYLDPGHRAATYRERADVVALALESGALECYRRVLAG